MQVVGQRQHAPSDQGRLQQALIRVWPGRLQGAAGCCNAINSREAALGSAVLLEATLLFLDIDVLQRHQRIHQVRWLRTSLDLTSALMLTLSATAQGKLSLLHLL